MSLKMFTEGHLSDVLAHQIQKLKQEVESQDRNYLLNANETQLVQHFIDKYRIEPLILHEDRIAAADREEMVAVGHRGFEYDVGPQHKLRKQVIRFHLPYSGEHDLLKYRPSRFVLWTAEVELRGGEVLFDVVNWNDDAADIKRKCDEFLTTVKQQVENLNSEVNAYNSRLEGEVSDLVQKRKTELLKKSNVLGSLGVPLKKAGDVPSTFAVPSPKKRVVISKPAASTAAFVPEPTLDDASYRDVLKIIHDTGIEIERHPSIYEGKDEETLRDHLLMVLSPHFQSVSGETFNKTGKTDILIRHEGKNLFVAECLVWRGAKEFLKKIDQLLSYLTWRDSKTAIVCFVKNKEVQSVLDAIKAEVPKHDCFVKELPELGEGWKQYEFTLKGDASRAVKVAVICFHFPPS